jgi:hypothetical protein
VAGDEADEADEAEAGEFAAGAAGGVFGDAEFGGDLGLGGEHLADLVSAAGEGALEPGGLVVGAGAGIGGVFLRASGGVISLPKVAGRA